MTDQPPSDRFKSEMPQIPGVSGPGSRATTAPNPAVKLVLGLLAVLLVVFLGARWALRPKHAAPQSVEQQPQIEVPSSCDRCRSRHRQRGGDGQAMVLERIFYSQPPQWRKHFGAPRSIADGLSLSIDRLLGVRAKSSVRGLSARIRHGLKQAEKRLRFSRRQASNGGKPLQPHGVRSAQIEQSSRKRLGARRDCSRLRSAPAPGYRNKSGGQKDTRRKSGVKRLRVTLRVYCGQIAIRPVPLDSCATQT